ncbi:hypothetical protein JNW88_00400 [Micromonospora sp. ATA32]|nr:hypothetical protein [Micromonospora sp. ATA32]
MTTFIPRPINPERAARIREHAMRWYGISEREAGHMQRPVKARLITNLAAHFKGARQATVETRRMDDDNGPTQPGR